MRVLGGLACVLVAMGCAPTESMRWHSLMRAAEQAQREGRATEAEETWRKAIAEVGPDDWRAAPTLERLARFYEAHGRAKEAEQAYRQTLALREKLRPSGPAVAHSLTDLAHLYHSQGRYSEAEPLYERALPMAEAAFGPTHRNVEVILSLLANLYANEGKYAEAERLYQRLLAGPNVDSLALGDLALLYEAQRRYSEAEPLRRRLLESAEASGTPREIAERLQSYAALLRKMDRSAEAAQMEARALAIFPESPRAARARPRIAFDKVEILGTTTPEARRLIGGFTAFEMTVTVRYTLQSVDTAALQLSPVRFQSAGCVAGTAFKLDAGPMLPLTRGEGSRVVPVRWFVGPSGGSATSDDQGYVTVQTALWSDQINNRRQLIRLFGQPRDFCYPFRAPDRAD